MYAEVVLLTDSRIKGLPPIPVDALWGASLTSPRIRDYYQCQRKTGFSELRTEYFWPQWVTGMDGNERVLVTAANGSLYMPRHPRLLEMMSRRFHGRVTLERTKPELPRFVIAIVEPGKRGGNEFLDPQPRINTPNIIVKADGQIGDRWGKRIRGIKGDFAGTVNWLPRRNRRSGLPVVRTGVVQSDKEDGVITVGDIVEIG